MTSAVSVKDRLKKKSKLSLNAGFGFTDYNRTSIPLDIVYCKICNLLASKSKFCETEKYCMVPKTCWSIWKRVIQKSRKFFR